MRPLYPNLSLCIDASSLSLCISFLNRYLCISFSCRQQVPCPSVPPDALPIAHIRPQSIVPPLRLAAAQRPSLGVHAGRGGSRTARLHTCPHPASRCSSPLPIAMGRGRGWGLPFRPGVGTSIHAGGGDCFSGRGWGLPFRPGVGMFGASTQRNPLSSLERGFGGKVGSTGSEPSAYSCRPDWRSCRPQSCTCQPCPL